MTTIWEQMRRGLRNLVQSRPALQETPATNQHVLIIGAGLVGLCLAQALKKEGISYSIYERDEDMDGRTQGFAITLHWTLSFLEKMLPKGIYDGLDSTQVDPSLRHDEGAFLVLDGRDASIIQKIPPSKRRVRANRTRLRQLLLQGLNVEYKKKLTRYEKLANGAVRVHFEDGTTGEGTLAVGCDGNNSRVRRQLCGDEAAALKPVPVVCIGVVQRYTPEQAAPLRAMDPLLFQTLHTNGDFIWHSIQDVGPDNSYYDLLTMVSHKITDPVSESQFYKTASDAEVIADMARRGSNFAEPLKSLVQNIDPSLKTVRIDLKDWVPIPYDHMACVTLAGDAAGPMTMYRGEGVNHGILDAYNLLHAVLKIQSGTLGPSAALDAYTTEVRERREVATPLSRQAAIDAHEGLPIKPGSPLVTMRAPPSGA